jgi:hypothetical protein
MPGGAFILRPIGVYCGMAFFSRKKKLDLDTIIRAVQDEVLAIAAERLGRQLTDDLQAKFRQSNRSLMMLEAVCRSVSTVDKSEIIDFLAKCN